MKSISNSLTALILILSLSSFTSSTITNTVIKWEKIGSSSVDFKLDRDVIHVGSKDGRFSILKLELSGGNIDMHKMQIEYLNGQIENIDFNHKFTKRSSSEIINIDGRRRIIKKITFWHNTKKRSKQKAKVTVFGK